MSNKDAFQDEVSADTRIKNTARAGVELVTGVVEAFGSAVRCFGDNVTKDSVCRASLDNGLIKGLFEGSASFLEDSSRVARKTYQILVEEQPRDGGAK
jgi:hypothetical protein